MEVPIRVIEGRSEKICGVEHLRFDFSGRLKPKVLITMHQFENFNNIEVFKFASWCKRNGYSITAYGMLNQLPLFGTFADEAILQVNSSWSRSIYPEGGDGNNSTTYETIDVFGSLPKDDFEDVIDISRPPGIHERWPAPLREAEIIVSDAEAAEEFKNPTIFVRKEALETYYKLSKDFISPNTVMCEVKVNDGCGGQHLMDVLKKKTEGYEIPFCFEMEYRRQLKQRTGFDLMSVQVLSSLLSNWMWVAYGGASNILPFFPIKILSLSDAYCRPELTRSLFLRRYGFFGDVFPELETLIYCFPGEEDGSSRTDGHRPLPNLRKLTADFSRYQLRCRMI